MTGRLSLILLLVAAVWACTPQPEPASDSAYGPAGLPALDWRTRIDGREIHVELEDPSGHYESVEMELLAPGGQRIPANTVTNEERVYNDTYGYGRPTFGVGGAAGSRGGGVGVGMSFPLGGTRSAGVERERLIVGRFVLPDLYEYRRTAAQWAIEITLTSYSGETSRATIPAPMP